MSSKWHQYEEDLEEIARQDLHVPTLRPRGSDSLDFHDVGVLGLRRALASAFDLGRLAQMSMATPKPAKKNPKRSPARRARR